MFLYINAEMLYFFVSYIPNCQDAFQRFCVCAGGLGGEQVVEQWGLEALLSGKEVCRVSC